jgi:SHS2 domain-containing protein
MHVKTAGFCEHEHTADWELEVWGPDLPALLSQAAQGMNFLSQTRLQPEPRLERRLVFQASDPEMLIVDFLSELIFLGEDEGLGFDQYDFSLQGSSMEVRLGGAAIAEQTKEIKAVTYHKLKIRKSERGLEVNIVFDV